MNCPKVRSEDFSPLIWMRTKVLTLDPIFSKIAFLWNSMFADYIYFKSKNRRHQSRLQYL